MDIVLQDIKYAFRALLRAPGFAAVAVATLALGIGANTAIFSVINAVLLRPLAYAEPEQLVALRGMVELRGLTEAQASAPEFLNYKDDVQAIDDAAAIWAIPVNLTGDGQPERLQAGGVSYNYTDVLGVQPVLGRSFTPTDAGGQIGYVALISWELYQRRFGGDPSVIGKTALLDDDPISIIGVMPRGFRHPTDRGEASMELWIPVDYANPDSNFVNNRRFRMLEVVGRLKSGVGVEQAQAELDVLTRRLAADHPSAYPAAEKWRATAVPLAERVVGDVKPALVVLLGAVGFVLLIACVNVANLMLTRATGRSREIAIRTALGSSRGRMIRQLLTESVLLSVAGGALGLLIAAWGTSALGQLATLYLPRARDIQIDGWVLGFTAAVSMLTGIAFGLLPAVQGSRTDLQSVLKDSGRGTSAGGSRPRMRATLVVVEVAVALVLVAGAGLLLRSFQRLVAVEPGFDASNAMVMQVWLAVPNDRARGRFGTNEQRQAYYSRLLEAMSGVPGVEGVALINRLPLRGQQGGSFSVEGRPAAADAPRTRAEMRTVSPNYFATMRIPLIRGEGLPNYDDSLSASTVVINNTMAQKYWPGENPVGQRIQLFGAQGPWFSIRGVVGDVRQIALEQPPREEIYFSYRRQSSQQASFVVRAGGDPMELRPAILQAIRTVDPEQPVFGIMSLEQLLAESNAPRRFSLLLLGIFASMALLLSALGIYGVMAYSTKQREQEIGIRMALGALPREVFGLVVGQGMKLVAIGLVLGLVGALALSRVLSAQLFEVGPRDPLTFLVAAAVLGAAALTANYLPARRATKVDPMVTLRND